MEKSDLKRYFQFMLIVLAAGAIYPVVYLKTNYQETMLAVFNMTLPQLNTIYTVLGIVFIIGYFPSGLLSDKFSAKKLLTLSLLGTAAGGFWFAQIPSYSNVIIVFCIWGVFSVFTFWSAHMKIVKLLAKTEEEGRFFGILDGGRGVIEAVLASIAVVIFSSILGTSTELADKRSAIVAIIYMYSSILLAVAVLVAAFVEDDQKVVPREMPEAAKGDSEKFRIKDIALVLKNKFVFVLGGIIFMAYTVTWVVYYLGGFMETNIRVDAVTVGKIMVAVLWMRPVGGIVGGFLADKIGKITTLMTALAGASVCLVAMAVLPESTEKPVFYALVIACGGFVYAIRGTYWSLLGNCQIEDKSLGVAVGFVSLLGYLPDVLLPIFNSFLFQTFGGNGGYNAYFISSAVIGGIGMALVSLFALLMKRRQSAPAINLVQQQ